MLRMNCTIRSMRGDEVETIAIEYGITSFELVSRLRVMLIMMTILVMEVHRDH